jgi:FkbM family methyltransferase
MSVLDVLKFITSHPVNSQRALPALYRFAKWQIASRMAPGAIAYDWLGGARFLVRRGQTGLTGNVYAGLHEFADMGYLLHVLRPGELFVDVGANLGSYTILAGAVAKARVLAFEPVPETFRLLVENVRLNSLDNDVEALNVGLGKADGVLAFTSDVDTWNHALAEGESSERAVDVAVTTLDRALRGAVPAMIKIDVEGYEAPVLEGAGNVLCEAGLHTVIMELNGSASRYGFDESAIMRTMLANGFRSHSYDPIRRTLLDLEGGHHPTGNTLFIRDIERVRELIRGAPAFTVFGRHY